MTISRVHAQSTSGRVLPHPKPGVFGSGMNLQGFPPMPEISANGWGGSLTSCPGVLGGRARLHRVHRATESP